MDHVRAVEYYRKAAEAGYAKAQYQLGVCYEEGIGVAKDLEKAKACKRLAKEAGYKER